MTDIDGDERNTINGRAIRMEDYGAIEPKGTRDQPEDKIRFLDQDELVSHL